MIIISQAWSFSEIWTTSPFLGRIRYQIWNDDLEKKLPSNLLWYSLIWMHILCNEQKHDDLEFGTGLSFQLWECNRWYW